MTSRRYSWRHAAGNLERVDIISRWAVPPHAVFILGISPGGNWFKFPRKCRIPPGKKRKKDGKGGKGVGPRELLIPPGSRSLEYAVCMLGDDWARADRQWLSSG